MTDNEILVSVVDEQIVNEDDNVRTCENTEGETIPTTISGKHLYIL